MIAICIACAISPAGYKMSCNRYRIPNATYKSHSLNLYSFDLTMGIRMGLMDVCLNYGINSSSFTDIES